ncbi:hypothetical protein C2S52_007282 [Perilla frutescens var. hirtella]|nr:hypothetical protein C2S51_008599 [Perilla frutescens var. frutescens]KAH6787730.1 hypothetical protein C2S52_007282 [Perilla frutescens var. hirtella]
MVNIPVIKFKRVADAFDEMSKAGSCESESSGSEHSADLSDLVNSFFEREIREQRTDFQVQDCLRKLFYRDDDTVKSSISAAVEKALKEVGDKNSLPEFKRRLMSRLRSSGFDAGLCKSKWEKSGSSPSGNNEYVDVNAGGSRYIVEVFLAGEFTIARPTSSYGTLLDRFPTIFVGKPEELKQIVRRMSKAIRKSLKSAGLNVPPWRRLAYLQAKWFGSYKRTTNEIPRAEAYEDLGGERFVGFAPEKVTAVSLFCRDSFAATRGVRVGNLAAAFNFQA